MPFCPSSSIRCSSAIFCSWRIISTSGCVFRNFSGRGTSQVAPGGGEVPLRTTVLDGCTKSLDSWSGSAWALRTLSRNSKPAGHLVLTAGRNHGAWPHPQIPPAGLHDLARLHNESVPIWVKPDPIIMEKLRLICFERFQTGKSFNYFLCEFLSSILLRVTFNN